MNVTKTPKATLDQAITSSVVSGKNPDWRVFVKFVADNPFDEIVFCSVSVEDTLMAVVFVEDTLTAVVKGENDDGCVEEIIHKSINSRGKGRKR